MIFAESKMNALALMCVFIVQNFVLANSDNGDLTPVTPDTLQKTNELKSYQYLDAIYSEEEKECLSDRKFLLRGKCYTLLTKGPCPKGEWVVLEKSEPQMKVACKKKPCNRSNEVWWPDAKRCVLKKWAKSDPCRGDGRTVIVNNQGEGQCGCMNYFGEMQDSNLCYEYYQQGPCDLNEVVTYDKYSGYAICSKDRCFIENNERNNRIKTYAPLNGIGKCYRLSSADPCEAVSNHSRFVVDYFTHVPLCSFRKLHLNLIDSPVLCRLDENKNCRNQVDVKSEDRLTFILQMKKHSELDVKKSKNKIKENLNKTMLQNVTQSEKLIINGTMNVTKLNETTMILNETITLNSTVIPLETIPIQNSTLINDNTTLTYDIIHEKENKTLIHNVIVTYNDTFIFNNSTKNYNNFNVTKSIIK